MNEDKHSAGWVVGRLFIIKGKRNSDILQELLPKGGGGDSLSSDVGAGSNVAYDFFHARFPLKGNLFKFAIYFVSMIYSIAGPLGRRNDAGIYDLFMKAANIPMITSWR